MSKNLTRKGIAFGALVALAATTFAGAPANAAITSDISTGLSIGTSYNSVVGYDNELELATTLAPGLSNATTLHYRISNPSGAKLQIQAGQTGSVERASGSATQSVELWDTETTPAQITTDADATAAGAYFETAATSFNVIPSTSGQEGSTSADNELRISVADADLDVTVTVYAWLDSSSNAANVQSDTELFGNTVTLKFYDQKNVTAVSEIVSPVTGASSVQATFTTTPELNGQQLGKDFIDASWTTQGNSNAVLAKNTSSDAATATTNRGSTTYNGTTKKWTSTAYVAYSQGNDAFNKADLGIFAQSNLPGTGVAYTATVFHGGNGATANTGVSFAVVRGLNFATDSADRGTFVANARYAATGTTYHTVTKSPVTYVGLEALAVTATAAHDGPMAASAVLIGGIEFWSVGTFDSVQASGIYSATPYIGTQKLGAASSSTNSAITASDTKATIVVSENVAAGYNEDASASDTVEVRTGTTSVATKATVYYVDSDTGVKKVAPAGVPVTGTIAVGGSATAQVNAAGAGVLYDVEYTDANGQVTFTVTATSPVAGNYVDLTITPQSIGSSSADAAKFRLVWEDAAYTIADLNDTFAQGASSSYRRVATSGTYTYNFAVLDQWGKAADAAKYRLQVVNSGRTVSSNTYTLSNGRVAVAVADAAQGSGSIITSTVNLQKDVSGTWTTQATESWDGDGKGTAVINVADAATESFLSGINGANTFAASRGSINAWLTEDITAKAVEAQDRRVSKLTQPAYATTAAVTGRLINKSTGLAHGGAAVTISGPSTILFSAGNVDAFGSITVLADDEGDFNVSLFSNVSQEDAVITFTSASGATKTTKVTFKPATAVSGTKLVVTATDATPGKTLVFTGKLTDKWGNAVDTDQSATNAAGASTLDSGDARLTVTYTGPGLLSGTLPVETGADGTFTVRVLLGTSDTGSAVVKATYGAANGTIAAADTGDNIDIVATATAVIGGAVTTGAKAAVSGSTGKFYVSVSNAAAKKVVIKVAGKFVKSFTGNAAKKTVVTKATKGSKKVTVYVGGKLVATKTVTVK